MGLGLGCLAQAYDEDDIETYSDSVLLTKEMSGGFILHSMGWGLEFRKGRNINASKLWLMEIDFSEMKSPKEIRVINPYFSNAKSYIYGKLNNVYLIRAGYGRHHLLNSKPYWGGVALRYFFSGGASFGLAKPVYLNIINLVSISPYYFEYELTTEKYDPEKHFRDNIYGRAAFIKGFNQMSFYPGLYGKFGFTFDFGPHDASIKTLEVGATIDLFPIPIPLMAYNDPEYYFLTIYLSVNFGKRFNR
jgi:hypothetical protein